MKKLLWIVPIFAIGIAVGGLTLPNVLSATRTPTTVTTSTQFMQQALNTSKGQTMIQACEGFMRQYQNQK